MSNNKTTPTNIAPAKNAVKDAVKKPNLFQRKVVEPIKKHPKIAIAVAGGVTLVSTAAFLGRSKDDLHAPSNVVFEPTETVVEDSDEDTTVA